jgi:hypothetical protein
VGWKIKWDPRQEQIVGDEEANQLLDRPCRKPYELPEPGTSGLGFGSFARFVQLA